MLIKDDEKLKSEATSKYPMQKFESGDHVRIINPRNSYYNQEAIIRYSYADYDSSYNFTGHRYAINVKESGGTSWHDECDMELIEVRCRDLLYQWIEKRRIEESLSMDLDYIFANGDRLNKECSSSVVRTLANCLGVGSLSAGDGDGGYFNWARNASIVMDFARPFLETGDKQGWLDYCETRNAVKPRHSND